MTLFSHVQLHPENLQLRGQMTVTSLIRLPPVSQHFMRHLQHSETPPICLHSIKNRFKNRFTFCNTFTHNSCALKLLNAMLKGENWGTLSHLPYCILMSIEINSLHTSHFWRKCFKGLNFAFLVAEKKFWFTVMPGSKCLMAAQVFPAHWLCKMPALYLTSGIRLYVQSYDKGNYVSLLPKCMKQLCYQLWQLNSFSILHLFHLMAFTYSK